MSNAPSKDSKQELKQKVEKYVASAIAQRDRVHAIAAIMELIDRHTEQIEKAYGGCKKCYGKGYATVKSQIHAYGTDGDIGGLQGKYMQDTPIQMNYCDCDRGKQLYQLTHNTNLRQNK